jgi:hypothetical protein
MIEWDLAEVMVQDMVIDSAVPEMLADEAEVAIDS